MEVYALSMLANSTINYTIFRNIEILKTDFFQITKYCEGNIKYLGIFHLLK
jgi:hypothetical protein